MGLYLTLSFPPSLPLCLSLSHLDFGGWVTLTELNLASNQLAVLPEEIQELTRLEILVLAQNSIRVSFTCPCLIHVCTIEDIKKLTFRICSTIVL